MKEGKNYSSGVEEADFRLSGYKQYWLKEVEKTSVAQDKDKVGTTLRPLPPGTVFRGSVRFKNLRRDELGLLLWCLLLKEGCFQSIGMGKSYGYGRMSVVLEELRLLSPQRLYGADLAAVPWTVDTPNIQAYIAEYDRYAGELLSAGKNKKKKAKNASERNEIKDFFYIRSKILQPGMASSPRAARSFSRARFSMRET